MRKLKVAMFNAAAFVVVLTASAVALVLATREEAREIERLFGHWDRQNR